MIECNVCAVDYVLTGVCVCVTLQEYDHGYYFVSTFIGEHIAHHAKFLNP